MREGKRKMRGRKKKGARRRVYIDIDRRAPA
jgi:hypothetical protein